MRCKECEACEVNAHSDESYCSEADEREIRLNRGQSSPSWCPKKVEKKRMRPSYCGEDSDCNDGECPYFIEGGCTFEEGKEE